MVVSELNRLDGQLQPLSMPSCCCFHMERFFFCFFLLTILLEAEIPEFHNEPFGEAGEPKVTG